MKNKQYLKIEVNEDKVIKIQKLCLKDAMWVSTQMLKIGSSPIINVIIDLMNSSQTAQAEAIEQLNDFISDNMMTFKDNIPKLIELIADNYEVFYEIFERILQDAVIVESIDNVESERKIVFEDDFSIDNLDELATVLIDSVKFNFEPGLKKLAKKFPLLALVSQ